MYICDDLTEIINIVTWHLPCSKLIIDVQSVKELQLYLDLNRYIPRLCHVRELVVFRGVPISADIYNLYETCILHKLIASLPNLTSLEIMTTSFHLDGVLKTISNKSLMTKLSVYSRGCVSLIELTKMKNLVHLAIYDGTDSVSPGHIRFVPQELDHRFTFLALLPKLVFLYLYGKISEALDSHITIIKRNVPTLKFLHLSYTMTKDDLSFIEPLREKFRKYPLVVEFRRIGVNK